MGAAFLHAKEATLPPCGRNVAKLLKSGNIGQEAVPGGLFRHERIVFSLFPNGGIGSVTGYNFSRVIELEQFLFD